MNRTSISWVLGPDGAPGFTWNPFAGCKPISKGCAHCYAARLASTRLAHLPAYDGLARTKVFDEVDGKLEAQVYKWSGEVRFFPDKLAEPLRRRKPTGIFVGDMGDVALLTNEQIAAIFGVMTMCPQHRFYLLTKRPARLREWADWAAHIASDPGTLVRDVPTLCSVEAWSLLDDDRLGPDEMAPPAWPLPNVWVGTSVCTQDDADKNIPELLRIPAARRFLSCEPLLEELDLRCLNDGSWYDREGAQCYDALTGHAYYRDGEHGLGGGPKVDLVICGGESGHHARPCRVEWIRSLVRQCREASVPAFVKQLGSNCQTRNENWTADEGDPDFPRWPDLLVEEDRIEDLPQGGYQGAPVRVHFRDRAGADMAEWPDDLRVREMPAPVTPEAAGPAPASTAGTCPRPR